MAYRIEITAPALSDIDDTLSYIVQDSKDAADKWLFGLETLIDSLDENPARYPAIRDTPRLEVLYRYAMYHSHRVIFRTDDTLNTVFIVRVYHGARKPLKDDDVV